MFDFDFAQNLRLFSLNSLNCGSYIDNSVFKAPCGSFASELVFICSVRCLDADDSSPWLSTLKLPVPVAAFSIIGNCLYS